jgi:hypothetical protein
VRVWRGRSTLAGLPLTNARLFPAAVLWNRSVAAVRTGVNDTDAAEVSGVTCQTMGKLRQAQETGRSRQSAAAVPAATPGAI